MSEPATPSPTAFSSVQTESIYPKGVERHWWSAARNRILCRLVRGLAERGDRVLEVGCGTGIVVDHLAGEGLDIRGCDLAHAEPASAGVQDRVELGTDVFDLPAERLARFRGLLLLDVLEHLPEPAAFVQRLLEHMPSLRWLLITVPARQELWSNFDEFNGHFRRYSRQDAAELIPAGVELLHAGYFFHSLWLPARLLTMLGRDRSTSFCAPCKFRAPLHGLLASLFDLEQRLLPCWLPGSSLALQVRTIPHAETGPRR